MKNLLKKSLLASAAILLSVSVAQNAEAQTVTVGATAEVSNELTITATTPMNFGEFIAIAGATPGTDDAIITLGTDNSITPSTIGTGANAAVIDASLATAAVIDIADGAPGATINVTIDSVVNPTDGTDSLTLDDFVTSTDTGADQTRTIGTPFTITYANPGPSQMLIGAALTTNAAGAVGSGTYTGSFDITFAY